MGYSVHNGWELHINKDLFDSLCGRKTYAQFHRELCEEFDLKLGYKSFMTLLDNKVRWMAVYAYFVSRKLQTPVETLFVPVKITGK